MVFRNSGYELVPSVHDPLIHSKQNVINNLLVTVTIVTNAKNESG